MRLFTIRKDGGINSNVTGYWLVEIKKLFSIAVLKFSFGTREAYHSHAFNSISWVLSGHLKEERLYSSNTVVNHFYPSFIPIITTKDNLHKVYGMSDKTWVLTFRGRWDKTWFEFINNKIVTLTNSRKIVNVKDTM